MWELYLGSCNCSASIQTPPQPIVYDRIIPHFESSSWAWGPPQNAINWLYTQETCNIIFTGFFSLLVHFSWSILASEVHLILLVWVLCYVMEVGIVVVLSIKYAIVHSPTAFSCGDVMFCWKTWRRYTGTFDRWVEQFEERAKLTGWSHPQRLYQLKLLLEKTTYWVPQE